MTTVFETGIIKQKEKGICGSSPSPLATRWVPARRSDFCHSIRESIRRVSPFFQTGSLERVSEFQALFSNSRKKEITEAPFGASVSEPSDVIPIFGDYFPVNKKRFNIYMIVDIDVIVICITSLLFSGNKIYNLILIY